MKFQAFPLAEILQDILELCQTAMGCPVEIEFAVNMYNTPDIQDEFCLLQIKPMVVGGLQKTDYLQLNEKKDVLCSSEMALGDGIINTIRNNICVDFDTFDRSLTRNIAKEIDVINRSPLLEFVPVPEYLRQKNESAKPLLYVNDLLDERLLPANQVFP